MRPQASRTLRDCPEPRGRLNVATRRMDEADASSASSLPEPARTQYAQLTSLHASGILPDDAFEAGIRRVFELLALRSKEQLAPATAAAIQAAVAQAASLDTRDFGGHNDQLFMTSEWRLPIPTASDPWAASDNNHGGLALGPSQTVTVPTESVTVTVPTEGVGERQRSLFLYFWDARDGVQFSGWWITPDIIGNEEFFFHCSVLAETPAEAPIGSWRSPQFEHELQRELRLGFEAQDGSLIATGEDATLQIQPDGIRCVCPALALVIVTWPAFVRAFAHCVGV